MVHFRSVITNYPSCQNLETTNSLNPSLTKHRYFCTCVRIFKYEAKGVSILFSHIHMCVRVLEQYS